MYVSDPTGPALPRVSYPINLRVVVVLMGIGPVYSLYPLSGTSISCVEYFEKVRICR